MVSQSLIAYQKIKEMIFHMEFTAGTRIPESIFSSKLNISRTPIRDALRRLEAEGLVVIELNRGATVREFSDHEVREIGEVRMMQDILSAQLASAAAVPRIATQPKAPSTSNQTRLPCLR